MARSKLDLAKRTIRFKYVLDRFVRITIRTGKMPFSVNPDGRGVRYSILPDAFFRPLSNAVVMTKRADGRVEIDPCLVAGASWKRYEPLGAKVAIKALEGLNESERRGLNRSVVYHYRLDGADFYTALEGKNRIRWLQIYGGMLTWVFTQPGSITTDLFRAQAGRCPLYSNSVANGASR